MFIATLIAPERLATGDISIACDLVGGRAAAVVDGVACDIAFDAEPRTARAALETIAGVDVVVQVRSDRRRELLVADMDSTMITGECIDELADYAGLKPQIAAITERAMRGELDFADALRSRVALLAGLSEDVLAQCLRERVHLTPGAKPLVRTFRAFGGRALLVSGGFTHFADSVAEQIGFDDAIANRLVVRDNVLTGEVEHPIVDAQSKKDMLKHALAGRPTSVSLAIGDGANDIPMIEAAGLGVAFHAKPKTNQIAGARIAHCDLTAILYAMGFAKTDWVCD